MSEIAFSDTSTTHVPPGSASSQVLNATPGLLNVHKSLLGSNATDTNDKNGKKDDVMFSHVHASIRTTMHEKDAVDRTNGSSSQRVPISTEKKGNEYENEMYDDDVDVTHVSDHSHTDQVTGTTSTSKNTSTSLSLIPHVQTHTQTTTTSQTQAQKQAQSVLDRVQTAGHEITNTTATLPPYPTIQQDTSSRVEIDGKVTRGSFDTKTIILRVDMRSSFSHFRSFGLPSGYSNNLTSIRRVMFRASEMTKI